MIKTSYKIATVWGIPIKIHISLILLLILLAIQSGIYSGPSAILLVFLFELSIFACIALHELGHSFVALRKGCRVRQITLMFIGGVAQMEEIPSKPKDEFQMAIAGPAVSVFLGILLWFGGRYLPLPDSLWPVPLFNSFGIRCNPAQYLGVINIWLAVFNLLPSFPMDGGRVFRAMLSPKMGRLRATFIAARLGKIIAVLWGIYGFTSGGSWIHIAIAFFIYSAAGNEYRMVQVQEAAKQQGFGFDPWPPLEHQGNVYTSDDKVIISPPPYEKGPDSETEIHSSDDDDNPFTNIFRR